MTTERLVAVGIRRKDEVYGGNMGARAHWILRDAMGDDDPMQGRYTDEEGFITSAGRFVTRHEAHDIALAAGQIRKPLRNRELLSSDIRWDEP